MDLGEAALALSFNMLSKLLPIATLYDFGSMKTLGSGYPSTEATIAISAPNSRTSSVFGRVSSP